MNEEKKNKIKFFEKLSLFFRKSFLMDNTITIVLIAVLVMGYISINLWVRELDLKEIDVTENKIYTLSDASKDAVQKVDQDIKIYAYGYTENSTFLNFLKQYHEANEKITYELLTAESNPGVIQKYNLANASGYTVVILESGDSTKVIDASTEFFTYDAYTYETVDITEQVMTNSIISLTEENKPKIYFSEGHNEITLQEMQVIASFLKNESFLTDTINLLTETTIPEDCDILAILTPATDLYEPEVETIKNYINRGGNLYITVDTNFKLDQTFPNLAKVLAEYGTSVKNGYIIESEKGKYYREETPYLFIPTVSEESDMTYDISKSNSKLLLMFASKLEFKDDDTLSKSDITKTVLLSTSEKSQFITNVGAMDLKSALSSAETGVSDISALLTKTITSTNESGEQEINTSNLIILTCGKILTDYAPEELGGSSPLSGVGSNKDFVLNGFSYLAKKDNTLTIRKDLDSSTYVATERQNRIVLLIIFIVPIVIIMFGILVWHLRKKRK